MPKITFVEEKKTIEVEPGTNLRTAARKEGVQIYPGIHKYLNCQGFGHCASCAVLITKGEDNVSKPGWWETLRLILGPLTFFARIGREKKYRLSCCTKVNGDVEVKTKPGVDWHGEKFWG